MALEWACRIMHSVPRSQIHGLRIAFRIEHLLGSANNSTTGPSLIIVRSTSVWLTRLSTRSRLIWSRWSITGAATITVSTTIVTTVTAVRVSTTTTIITTAAVTVITTSRSVTVNTTWSIVVTITTAVATVTVISAATVAVWLT